MTVTFGQRPQFGQVIQFGAQPTRFGSNVRFGANGAGGDDDDTFEGGPKPTDDQPVAQGSSGDNNNGGAPKTSVISLADCKDSNGSFKPGALKAKILAEVDQQVAQMVKEGGTVTNDMLKYIVTDITKGAFLALETEQAQREATRRGFVGDAAAEYVRNEQEFKALILQLTEKHKEKQEALARQHQVAQEAQDETQADAVEMGYALAEREAAMKAIEARGLEAIVAAATAEGGKIAEESGGLFAALSGLMGGGNKSSD